MRQLWSSGAPCKRQQTEQPVGKLGVVQSWVADGAHATWKCSPVNSANSLLKSRSRCFRVNARYLFCNNRPNLSGAVASWRGGDFPLACAGVDVGWPLIGPSHPSQPICLGCYARTTKSGGATEGCDRSKVTLRGRLNSSKPVSPDSRRCYFQAKLLIQITSDGVARLIAGGRVIGYKFKHALELSNGTRPSQ